MSFPATGSWTLFVSVPSGSLDVHTHDLPQIDVHVRDVKDPHDVVVRADDRAREVSVTQNRRGRFNWFGSATSIDVAVPEGTSLRIKGEALDTRASGQLGTVTVGTASGDVDLDTVDGELRVHSASGDLHADHVIGPVTARSASGDVDLNRADHDITVQTVSGDVRVDGLRYGRASVQSVSGDVDLAVTKGLHVRLELTSLSGDTQPQLDINGDGPPSRAAVSLDVKVRTVSGDITVRRSDQSPG